MRSLLVLLVVAAASIALSGVGAGPALAAPLPGCGGDRPYDPAGEDVAAPTVQPFIAHPSEVQPTAAELSSLRAGLSEFADMVRTQSGGRKSIRLREGVGGCAARDLDVVDIDLGPASGYGSVAAAAAELDRRLANTPLVVWAGVVAGLPGAGGITQSWSLGQPRPQTPAQDAAVAHGGVSVAASTEPGVIGHEILHALGAVSPSALHFDPAHPGHVLDPADVMYWAAGGDAIDVAHDDYFNPAGPIRDAAGRPLWNVFDSLYLCPAAGCDGPLQRPIVSLSMQPAAEPGRVTVTARGADLYEWFDSGSPQPTGGPVFSAYLGEHVAVRGFAASGAASRLTTIDIPQTQTTNNLTTPTTGPRSHAARPRIFSLRVSPRRRRGHWRATITFRLSSRATVRLRFARRAHGYRPLRGSRSLTGHRGRNRFRFDGRLRGRRLRSGRYRLTAVATGPTGRRSARARAKFAVRR